MIERYTREKMKKIWDIQTRFEYYLKVEIAVCKAYSDLGYMSVNDYEQISKLAKCVDIREDEPNELLKFALENNIDLTIAISEKAIKNDKDHID